MENSIKYYIQSLLLLIFLSFVSCEKGMEEVAYDGRVYIPQAGISEVVPLLGESTYKLGIYKSGINDNRDPKVTLEVDPALLEEFLIANPEYEMLPEQYYSIPNKEVRFSGDESTVFMDIQLKNIGADYLDKHYILPVRIVKVSDGVELVSDRSSVLLQFHRYRSIYEGEFEALGQSYPVEQPEERKKIDQTITALTVSENVVSIPGAETGMTLHLDISGNAITVLAAPGSEHFNIVDDSSSITGEFNETYQRFRGDMHLRYKYTMGGTERYAEVNLTFNL